MAKILCFILSSLLCWSSAASAADLIDVYCEAVACDPKFNADYAALLANRQAIPISRAELLPRLDIHAEVSREKTKLQGINFSDFQSTGVFIPHESTKTFYQNVVYYYLKLSQPVFNYKSFSQLKQSKATVLQAEATFCASTQDLISRVARAYFDILIADTNLFYTRQHKKAVAEQLRQTRIEFKVGTVPITNVYEAKAAYDLVVAQEVSDRYALASKIEVLRTITGHLYCNLKGLSAYLPLIVPDPKDINGWACSAEKQNWQLLAARYSALATRENIKIQASDSLPVINSYGQYTFNYLSNFQGSGILSRERDIEAGVELNWSPIRGGGIRARTTQAQYQYQQAMDQQEQIHRKVVSDARNAYLGIFTGIAEVKAYREAVRSGEVSLKATIESYKVGLRTILDVLNQETQLYQAEKNFAQARYDYIYQIILLKQAAGTLNLTDLQHINTWLYSTVDIANYDALLDGCLDAQF